MPKNTSSRTTSAAGSRPGRAKPPAASERQTAQTDRKAAVVIDAVQREAERIRRAAQVDAARIRAEAEEHARRLVLDARASADGVRAEGMELVSNLREMGDVLRSNAERLLRDIQTIHSRMMGELGQVEPAEPTGGAREAASGPEQDAPEHAEVLEVPDFVSRG